MSIQESYLSLRGGAASKRPRKKRNQNSTGIDASFLNDKAITTLGERSQNDSATESLKNVATLEEETKVRHSQETKTEKSKRFIAFIGERGRKAQLSFLF